MLDFVCFSQNNWEKRKARKQQLMIHLSKRKDVERVLYIEPPLNFVRLLIYPFSELKDSENKTRWRRALNFKIELLSDKLFLFTPIFFIPFSFRIQLIYNINLFISLLIIKTKIKKLCFKNIVLWFYHPFDYLLLRWFRNRILSVFDWAEEWAEYFIELNKKRREKIKTVEEEIIKNVDIVFVVSRNLLEKAKKFNPDSYHLLDGTVNETFQKPSYYIPEDIKHIKKPILGYLGTINQRLDVELLELISKELPRTSLVFIGDIHFKRINISRLKSCENINFLGGKNYEELGHYTQSFDICILPYKPELTPSFPTKILDYLATGKPIVSTDLYEMNRFKDCVYIAHSKEEFVNFIKIALNENNPQLFAVRIKAAKNNTWEKRASQIMEFIKNQANA